MRQVCYERIKFTRVPPSKRAERYRKSILRIALSRGSNLVHKHVVLRELPNGDMTKRHIVEIYVPEGIAIDGEKFKRRISTSTADVLVHGLFTKWPEHRWLEHDVALNEYILGDGFAGLFSAAYPRFMASRKDTSSRIEKTGAPLPVIIGVDALTMITDGLGVPREGEDAGISPEIAVGQASHDAVWEAARKEQHKMIRETAE